MFQTVSNGTFMKIILSIIVFIIIYLYIDVSYNEIVFVKSNINGKRYLVRNIHDKQEAADLLSQISINLEKIIEYLKTTPIQEIYIKFKNTKSSNDNELDNDDIIKLKKDIKRLIKNFNPENFTESSAHSKYTSYSVNKGEKIVFCLRSKDAKADLVKQNTMMFVAIHELGHLMTKSINHTPEFWDNMKFLLKVSIHIKVYKHVNFNKHPEEYCGTEITDTPLKLD
jgi:hypothetical protein